MENAKTIAILEDLVKGSSMRDCDNSTIHFKCLAQSGMSVANTHKLSGNFTDHTIKSGILYKGNISFLNSHEDLTNKLREKRNSRNATINSTITSYLANATEELPDSSYVNPVLERAPLPYTNLKAGSDDHNNLKTRDSENASNHKLGNKGKIKSLLVGTKKNNTDNIHALPGKPKYVFAPVTPTLKKYKIIQRRPDSKVQESSPPHVIYSDESDDSLFDYIEDMRTKNSNLYPYRFPDFNFPNLNHASFNFDDSDDDSEAVRGGDDGEGEGRVNESEETKRKQMPSIIDAHDSHDMEHEYVASEEGLQSEKKEKTQQPENENDEEDEKQDDGEEEEEEATEEGDDDYNEENKANKQDDEEEEDYADKGDGEQKREEETEGEEEEEEEEENKEDDRNQEEGRTKDQSNNYQHINIPVQGSESPWRPSDFPASSNLPSHNSQRQNNVRDEYNIPVTRYPYLSTDDIKQSFISHPLAGPTASKGFNHDFTPLRGGRPLTNGPFGVEPPHKYPVVPLFNKNTLHRPLSTTVPVGPVSPINLSGFNGYKHFVAPLVSAEDQTPYHEYNNPRQSGSRYRATYKGGVPPGLKATNAHRGKGNVKEEKVIEQENDDAKEDEFPPELIKEDDDNVHYQDFDDFDRPTKPYILDNSSTLHGSINHRIKPHLSSNNNPNSLNFFNNYEGKKQQLSNSNPQRLRSHTHEDDTNYHQTIHDNNNNHKMKQDIYRNPKSTFNTHPKQTSTHSKNKFFKHNGSTQLNKPFFGKSTSGYIANPEIQESGKYDYPYASNENENVPQTNLPYPTVNVNGDSVPSNYPTKTSYEDYSFPKKINFNDFYYPVKSNHKNYNEQKEINKYHNYPSYNDSSFEAHTLSDNPGHQVDFKTENDPYNFTSFGDLSGKQKYYHNLKNSNLFDTLQTTSPDTNDGKDIFRNGYKHPFSINDHYPNAHDSSKRQTETHYGHYNVPPYESISNYRKKNLGDLSPTPSSNGHDTFGNSNEKYKNHKPKNKKRNKSKLKKASRGKKKNSKSGLNMKAHRNPSKVNSNMYTTQEALHEDTVTDFDTMPNPSIPFRIYGNDILKSNLEAIDKTDSENGNAQSLIKGSINSERTKSVLPKKSIYDLHGLYHSKNYKSSENNDNNNMKTDFIDMQGRKNLPGIRTPSKTNHPGYYYDFPNIKSKDKLGDKHLSPGLSYDEEFDEPSTETPEVEFVRKSPGKNSRVEDISLKNGDSKSLSKKELVDTLNKILDKKDTISREKNIDENGDQLNRYSNYWVLEYSMPTE